MQKFVDVATPIQLKTSQITFLHSEESKMDKLVELSPMEWFSDHSIEFIADISKEITKDARIREYPDVATFSFFCRKANIQRYSKRYSKEILRLGRGIAFHIAPSNVPVNFAYSLLVGLISGNSNIVRVPSKNYEQVDIICNAIKRSSAKPEFSDFLNRLFIVRYERDSAYTKEFSSICDVRIIWGGDETIKDIRKSGLPARSFDVTFADRYSFAILDAEAVLLSSDLNKLAQDFYNDTYLFDQNACSAPHLVVWTGSKDKVEKAKKLFWDAVETSLSTYESAPVIAVNKLTTFYLHSANSNQIKKIETNSNKLWRVEATNLENGIENHKCAGGYFIEYHANSIDEIRHIVNRKYQTLAYYGFNKEDLKTTFRKASLNGIDRIVPIGHTTDFDLIWDGYDLPYTLSRECSIL